MVYLFLKPVEPAPVVTDTTQSTTKSPATQPSTTTTTTEEQTTLHFSNSSKAKEYVEGYAKEKGYSIQDYREKFFDLMVKDPSAIPYVLDYPAKISESRNYAKLDKDELKDGVPLFLQWDTRWGYHSFKSGVVGPDGCGATAFSMTAVYLTGDTSLTPDLISDYIADNGYFVVGSGTSWDFFTRGIEHYGVHSTEISKTEAKMKEVLDDKNPIIVSVGPGDFTSKGHFIVIAGYDKKGFIVNDPYSLVNSQMHWSFERLKPQIRTMWEIYK